MAKKKIAKRKRPVQVSGNVAKARLGATATPAPAKAKPALGPGRGDHWPQLPPYRLALPLALQFQLQQSEWWSPARLLAQQLRQAQRLIKHAAASVPFYRTRLKELAALPPGKLTLDALRAIPVMTRSDIQEAGSKLYSRAIPSHHGGVAPVRSSGSTGRPIEIASTELVANLGLALTMRGHLWHRRDFAEKNVDIRTAFAEGKAPKNPRWIALPQSGPSVRLDINLPINTLFDQLIEEKPGYLQSHPYTILGLVERSVELGIKPKRLKEVRTFGEALTQRIRAAVKQHWGVPVADNYSAMEIGTIAQQCPESTNLHVQSEFILVEVLNEDGGPTTPGSVGRVVLTPLHNFPTPLIRYEIGDYAEVGAPCACGRSLPVLTRIVGRHRNLVVLPNGVRFFPEVQSGLLNIIAVRQFQLLQKSHDEMQIKLALDEPLDNAQRGDLTVYLQGRLRHPFAIEIVEVDDIPRAPNGKFEEFTSNIAGARLEDAL